CDQFTSQRDYWQTLEAFVGDSPSTLKLIFPEVYLEDDGEEERTNKINATMKEYLDSNVFYTLKEFDVAGWLKSLQLRGVELPEKIKEEALLIISERRFK
ncbi:MAG: DUF1015 family protein, partial [Paludibacteraceae bacterium]|nr:DUF1015 family protein [Paludibacteraceae bacterium]